MQPILTQGEKVVWINIPLTSELRKRIKIIAAQREQTSREFIVGAVKASIADEPAAPSVAGEHGALSKPGTSALHDGPTTRTNPV